MSICGMNAEAADWNTARRTVPEASSLRAATLAGGQFEPVQDRRGVFDEHFGGRGEPHPAADFLQ
ncbi:MAG: hypothetical protein PGN37_25820 [Mycobacterium kyogaense]